MPSNKDLKEADRRSAIKWLSDLYQQNVGEPFTRGMQAAQEGQQALSRNITDLARGYFGMGDQTGTEVFRTGQALGNMPGTGAPAGAFKALANLPGMLDTLGGALGVTLLRNRLNPQKRALVDAYQTQYDAIKNNDQAREAFLDVLWNTENIGLNPITGKLSYTPVGIENVKFKPAAQIKAGDKLSDVMRFDNFFRVADPRVADIPIRMFDQQSGTRAQYSIPPNENIGLNAQYVQPGSIAHSLLHESSHAAQPEMVGSSPEIIRRIMQGIDSSNDVSKFLNEIGMSKMSPNNWNLPQNIYAQVAGEAAAEFGPWYRAQLIRDPSLNNVRIDEMFDRYVAERMEYGRIIDYADLIGAANRMFAEQATRPYQTFSDKRRGFEPVTKEQLINRMADDPFPVRNKTTK